MTELYAFIFAFGLGITARLLYLAESALAKRTNLIPVTAALDVLTALVIGGALTVYVILTATVIAPYIFASLFAGYYFTYLLTRKSRARVKALPESDKQSAKAD